MTTKTPPPEPNQDLPEEPDDDVEANQDLPDQKQPPRGRGNNRGKSEDAPGQTKDAENDPTVIDESPADAEGNRPEGDWEDPNTYPDPENPSHTP